MIKTDLKSMDTIMKGMSIIVKKVTQLLSGLIFLYGLYIIVHGHLTPGGGFAGGTILSGAFILVVISFGTDILKIKKEKIGSKIIESIAILFFLLIGTIGIFISAAVFFENYLPKGKIGSLISAGLIPIFNIVVGIEVAAALFSIFLALVIYKEET